MDEDMLGTSVADKRKNEINVYRGIQNVVKLFCRQMGKVKE